MTLNICIIMVIQNILPVVNFWWNAGEYNSWQWNVYVTVMAL